MRRRRALGSWVIAWLDWLLPEPLRRAPSSELIRYRVLACALAVYLLGGGEGW